MLVPSDFTIRTWLAEPLGSLTYLLVSAAYIISPAAMAESLRVFALRLKVLLVNVAAKASKTKVSFAVNNGKLTVLSAAIAAVATI